jgi:hypothetical protein
MSICKRTQALHRRLNRVRRALLRAQAAPFSTVRTRGEKAPPKNPLSLRVETQPGPAPHTMTRGGGDAVGWPRRLPCVIATAAGR